MVNVLLICCWSLSEPLSTLPCSITNRWDGYFPCLGSQVKSTLSRKKELGVLFLFHLSGWSWFCTLWVRRSLAKSKEVMLCFNKVEGLLEVCKQSSPLWRPRHKIIFLLLSFWRMTIWAVSSVSFWGEGWQLWPFKKYICVHCVSLFWALAIKVRQKI